MISIMFEQLDVPAFYLAGQGPATLFALGKTTGLVLEAGDGVTHAVPVN